MDQAIRITDAMNWVLRHLVGAMLGVMVIVVGLQIVVRFLLPRLGIILAVPWSEELARYLMIWCIFLGAAVATRAGDLIAVESLVDSLPQEWGRKVKSVSFAITIAFLALLIWLGVRWVQFGESETSTVMNIPMAWVYLAMPVGSAVAIINICIRWLDGMVKRRPASAWRKSKPSSSTLAL